MLESIYIDIANRQLTAYDNHGPVLIAPVVVGKPSTPTPTLESYVSQIIVNPSWIPTPRLRRNFENRYGKQALLSNGFYYAGGNLIQRPGLNNSMGAIKIRFDNRYSILLHGTNNENPFFVLNEDRNISNGCVRMLNSEIKVLAEALLGRSLDAYFGNYKQFPDKVFNLEIKIPIKIGNSDG